MLPIKPDEVTQEIPNKIIEIFNNMIRENYIARNKKSTFKQKEIVNRIIELGYTEKSIYDRCYLDVEPLYVQVGWKVKHQSPDRDQDFDSYFVFSK